MIKYFLFAALAASQFFLSAAPLEAQSASQASIEAKLALENSLEKRVRMVLSEALGTEDGPRAMLVHGSNIVVSAPNATGRPLLTAYLPTRTALVLQKIR